MVALRVPTHPSAIFLCIVRHLLVQDCLHCVYVTVPGASLSKPLIVTLAKGQSRHSVEFEETPEWSVLQQTVEDTFPEHMVEEYKLKIGKHLLTQRNWKTLSAEQSKDCSVTVAVGHARQSSQNNGMPCV